MASLPFIHQTVSAHTKTGRAAQIRSAHQLVPVATRHRIANGAHIARHPLRSFSRRRHGRRRCGHSMSKGPRTSGAWQAACRFHLRKIGNEKCLLRDAIYRRATTMALANKLVINDGESICTVGICLNLNLRHAVCATSCGLDSLAK